MGNSGYISSLAVSWRNETADSTRTLRVSQLRTRYMMPCRYSGLSWVTAR
jgi:hypothetical protein